MDRFEEAEDLLAEQVSDEELRELLERFGEAEVGGSDQVTVGAIVEATGADSLTILRILREIRQQTIEDQRLALEAIDRRVSRLEARSGAKATTPTVESGDSLKRFALIAIVPVSILVLVFGTLAQGSGKPYHPYGESTWYAPTSDGQVVLTPDGAVEVKRTDGTTRPATDEEALSVEAFAASVGLPRTDGR